MSEKSTQDPSANLKAMQAAQLREGPPGRRVRQDRLSRAIRLLADHEAAFCEAVSEDFGHRSADQTALADLVQSVSSLKNAQSNLGRWMRPSRRAPEFPFGLVGASAKVLYQPKGVVGIVAPWNFPVSMVFSPLAGVLAAGNRAMVKPSEFTPRTAALLARLVPNYFSPEEIFVVNGDASVGAAFAALPFDHIIFTGSTSVGKHIMRAAADNLTPVTLELGGKSPVVLGASADLEKAAMRIMHGKVLNAGQICTAPDYVYVPAGREEAFRKAAMGAIARMYPDGIKDHPDYTSIINQRHYDRLRGLLQDAAEKGAILHEINPQGEDFSQQPYHKIPPTLVEGVTDEMALMQEEIFGPILPIRGYESVDGVIADINARPRPLALYYFGQNAPERDKILNQTTSGGVTVNDTIFHVAQENLPFGGTGPSGMGNYHGREGFVTFSHAKSVYTQTGSEFIAMLRPPYGKLFRWEIRRRLGTLGKKDRDH
ncbi:MAG: coniferyl aldehyde dehydrogenase [Parvularcula sp.]